MYSIASERQTFVRAIHTHSVIRFTSNTNPKIQ